MEILAPTSAVPESLQPRTYAPFNIGQAMGTPRMDTTIKPTTPATDPSPMATVVGGLAGHLRAKWEQAKQHREQSGVDEQIMRAKRARDLQYEPSKLAQIQAVHGPEYDPPYDPIIDVKCRALEAWLTDIILTPGDRPWSLEPTPIPDLPEDIRQALEKEVEQRVAMQVAQEALAQGGMPSIEEVEARTKEIMPMMKAVFLAEMKRKAREAVEKMTQKIDDQLTEGKWRLAIKQIIYDFVTYPACFLKGPTLRKDRRFTQKFDPLTRKHKPVVEERKIDTWTRVAPDKIYPEPHSSSINGGYLFELASYKRKDLYGAIGIDGYDEAAIRRVLQSHSDNGLHEWTLTQTERQLLEKKSTFIAGSDVDTLIFWGTVPGKYLIEWGMNKKSEVITDPEREYDVWAEMIGTEVIMARLNPDPLCEKPYYKACLIEDPDRFWNKAMPDLLRDISNLCCAVLRASGINAAFAAGPIMAVNVDHLENRNDSTLYPQRVVRLTNKQMSEGKLVDFYQPNLLVGPLGIFLDTCHTFADEWSGLPRITHGGDQSSTGVTSTASGTSMFITASSRGIKAYAKNFDVGLVEPSVTKQYQVDLWEQKDDEFSSPYLDAKVVARGSSSLIAKEQQSVRRNEFSTTLSPEEKQILGMDGIKEILRQKIQALEMDTDKLLPDDRALIEKMTGWQVPGQPGAQPGMQPALPAPEAMSPSGDKPAGAEFALFQGAQA